MVFADGEITSNLRWTQAIYDKLQADNKLSGRDPLNEDDVIAAATSEIETLMSEEFIVHTDFVGAQFTALLNEVKALIGKEDGIKRILQQADAEAKAYAKNHIKQKPEGDKARAGKAVKAG